MTARVLRCPSAWLPTAVLAVLAANAAFLRAQAPTAAASDAEAGFRAIFNGRDLSGWDADRTCWSVREGAIVGECNPAQPPKHNTFCVWTAGEEIGRAHV